MLLNDIYLSNFIQNEGIFYLFLSVKGFNGQNHLIAIFLIRKNESKRVLDIPLIIQTFFLKIVYCFYLIIIKYKLKLFISTFFVN